MEDDYQQLESSCIKTNINDIQFIQEENTISNNEIDNSSSITSDDIIIGSVNSIQLELSKDILKLFK